jgi:hypothetical protein
MYWPIFIYLIASIILTVTSIIHVGIISALCLFGTSMISFTAAGGLKFGILWGDKAQKIGVPLLAVLFLAFAYWLFSGFSVQLLGYHLSGLTWGIIGVVIGIIFVDRKMAS